MNDLFATLLAAEATVPPMLARRRAHRYLAHLRLVSERDKTDLKAAGVISDDTIVRLVRAMRRAGVAPIVDSNALAAVCRDLGIADRDSATRLVWTLNSGHSRTHAAARDRWQRIVGEAAALMATDAEASMAYREDVGTKAA